MTVVLACGGILLAIAVPNFQQLRNQWALWGAAHLVESSLQWGRLHAVSSNGSLRFDVEQDGSGYHWTDPETGAPYEASRRILPWGVRIVSSPHTSLRFYPHANAAPAGTFVIRGDAGQYRVIVSIAGRIRVQRD